MTILNASICMDAINEAKINIGKNGKRYLNISVVVKDELDQYGNNVTITHSQTKEEREAKAQIIYLGNGKKVFEK